LATPNATFTHTGGTGPVVLRWTISNGSCTPSTADLAVAIAPSPTVATVGGGQTICGLGTTAGLGANTPAIGTGNWSVVSGGTGTFSPNLATPNATFTHTGGTGPVVLRWTISNGSCTPSTADLAVTIQTVPLAIASQPLAQTVCVGKPVEFAVNATGQSLKFQWHKGTAAISGATEPVLRFAAVTSEDAGLYSVLITDACGANQASEFAALGVQVPLTITGAPEAVSICAGVPFALSVSAVGEGLSYQWRKDGVDIPGGASAKYAVPLGRAEHAGRYTVLVKSDCGEQESSPADVQIRELAAPVVLCPKDIIRAADSDKCGAVIDDATLGTATATDACGGKVLVERSGVPDGNVFPVGKTRITYTAANESGKRAVCEQLVTVEDKTAPIARCKGGIQLELTGAPILKIKPSDVDDGSSDNCGIVSMSLSRSSFTVEDLGSNPVTLTVTDAAGNSASCDTVVEIVLPAVGAELDIAGTSVKEGDSGRTVARFVVTMTETLPVAATVDYQTIDGTAKAGSDYEAAAGKLTFAPGELSKEILVNVIGDLLNEGDETFSVTISNAKFATVVGETAVGTILDDDAPPVVSIGNVAVVEGDDGWADVTLTVELSAPSARRITVDFATEDGTAVEGGDYLAGKGTLVFEPGQPSSAPAAVSSVRLASGNVPLIEIAVTDGRRVVSWTSDSDGFQLEETGDFVSWSPVAARPEINGNRRSVSIVDATPLKFYRLQPAPAGIVGGTRKKVTFQVRSDTVYESDETFFVRLSNPLNATPGKFRGVVTIINDDALPTLGIADVTVTEGNSGVVNAQLKVTLTGQTSLPVTVKWATADGTAVAPGDYAAANGTLTFAPGENSKTITVAVNGDLLNEADELFNVDLSAPVGATITPHRGIVTILNDDAQPTLSIADVTVTEGNSGTVNAVLKVTLAGTSSQPVTVKWATSDGTAVAPGDYVAAKGTLTFAPGESSKTITVAVNGDLLNEADELFTVDLSAPVGATIAKPHGVVTILNDDGAPTLGISDVIVTEGNSGTVNAVLKVTLTGQTSQPVTVNWATADGTAAAPGDYAAAKGTLTFAPGESSKTITVAVNGDLLNEADELFNVDLSAAVGATITQPRGVVTILNDDALPTLSIADVTVTEGNSGTVNAVFTITMSVPSERTVSVDFKTVDGTAQAPGDYQAASGQVVFAPAAGGQPLPVAQQTLLSNPVLRLTETDGKRVVSWTSTEDQFELQSRDSLDASTPWRSAAGSVALSGQTRSFVIDPQSPAQFFRLAARASFAPGELTKKVTIQVNGDTINESDETFFVDLANAVNATISKPRGMATILNDDAPPTLSITDVTVTEGNTGTVNAVLKVTLAGTSSQPVTVKWATADGTAVAPGDYAAAIGTLTFAPGESSKTITVAVNGDSANEADELFNVDLSAAVGATITQPRGAVTILNDDAPPTLSIADVTVTEGNSGVANAQLKVTLAGASSQPVTVKWATADGTAVAPGDYAAAKGTLTFAPGESSKTITVAVNGDLLNEADELFNVDLSAATGATITKPRGVVTILNDDALPTLSISDVTVTEGNSGTVNAVLKVTLAGQTSLPVTVKWTTTDGTAAAPGDYAAANGTLTFAPGESSKTITVAVNGDLLNEADELFNVDLSAPVGATIAKPHGVVTILNDDGAPTLSIAAVTVTEGNSGTVNAVLKVTLAGQTSLPVTVKWATADGTAAAPGDYAAANGTLTFAPGESSKTITVAVNGDLLNEADELFNVDLSASVGAVITKPHGVVTILNDDALPTLGISDVTVTEGNAGTTDATLLVSLSAASTQSVKVNYATVDGTARLGSDYQIAVGTLTFLPGETVKPLTIKIIADLVAETTESLGVVLNGVVNATLAKDRGTITILDDDKPNTPPQVAITSPDQDDSFLAGMTIGVAASATDPDGKVVRVDFRADGQLIGSAKSEPFAILWSGLTVGTHQLTATAVDDLGATSESAPVGITVRADDGRKRVGIIQGFADPEITKLQSYLSDIDMTSQVFRRDNLNLEILKQFDLVVWDDLSDGVAGKVLPSEVTLLQDLFKANIPLYFIGSDLARSGAGLSGSARTAWAGLLHLNVSDASGTDPGFEMVDRTHRVSNGPFGIVGDFKLAVNHDAARQLGTGETLVTQTADADVVLAFEDPTTDTRIVTQDFPAFNGVNLNSRIQREKLFKNAVWWLLKLAPPPPFLNLSVAATAEPVSARIGDEITVAVTVRHAGEFEATGVTLTVEIPAGVEIVSITSPDGTSSFEDNLVVCAVGRLSGADQAVTTIVLRAKTAGPLTVSANVSANQPEAVTRDNGAGVTIDVGN
jgi:uncharacterized repeat protein (TIGR01451 family)